MPTSRLYALAALVLGLLTMSSSPAPAVQNGDVPVNTPASARRMIEDLVKTYGEKYPGGKAFLQRLDEIQPRLAANAKDAKAREDLDILIREASLANPLLDFDKLLIVRRKGEANRALNAYTSTTIKRTGWDNEIAELSNLRGQVKVRSIHRPDKQGVVKHLDLNFDGKRIMFSGVGKNGCWGILEIDPEGKNLKELTPDDQQGIQWFDGCYLPEEGLIVACSTAGMQGLPCVNGGEPMVNIYRVDVETKQVRQLTFEQDSDWHPRVHHNGKVMYLRWEYTDTPHYFSRRLFQMNPDGTGQVEYWGSGSYFPAAYVWARPVPNHPSLVVGLVSGHHAKSETGRLLLIDPAFGRRYPLRFRPKDKVWGPEGSQINIHGDVFPAEETGCMQEIPGWGRHVVGNVYDNQGGGQKYTFQTPWPLSDKYFLVTMQGFHGPAEPAAEGKSPRRNGGKWTLCLVDVFDNMTVVYSDPDYDLFEPIPLVARTKPPALADHTRPGQPTTVFCTDVYYGRGLEGVPRGKVKSLRVIGYHYGYMHTGGHESVGLHSSWDIKRILGTVPVEEDGSFTFEAPANVPLAVQPLDENGAALALMRSWMVGMPGERMSCHGCHEDLRRHPPQKTTIASRIPPHKLTPWRGPIRPFSYAAEIKPMVDKFCVGCHNEKAKAEKGRISFEKGDPNNWRNDRGYLNLCAFVRRPGPESDLDFYDAMEWHASTSPLIQMLKKGHHGVQLDAEAWDRLYTWIDLNAPHRGMWNSPAGEKRRLELAIRYAGLTDNPEEEYRQHYASLTSREPVQPIIPAQPPEPKPDGLTAPGFPMTAEQAAKLQNDAAPIEVTLAEGLTMKLVRIPPGSFVMGSQGGYADEAPRSVVRVEKAFWMGVTEVTNRQYEAFDPKHDTRYLEEHGKDHAVPGYIANHPDQPVARVSWQEAMKFCQWLASKTGKKVTLPTEAQWEWAARSGSDTQFYYGTADSDFSKFANLADADRRNLYTTWEGGSTIHRRRPYPADYLFPLRDDRFKDNWFVVDYVAQCQPNAWGLKDIVGNVSEWTRTDYKPYPYQDADGRNQGDVAQPKVARGGSWNDRPKTAGSTVRFPFESYQKVYNVGFRVIIEE